MMTRWQRVKHWFGHDLIYFKRQDRSYRSCKFPYCHAEQEWICVPAAPMGFCDWVDL